MTKFEISNCSYNQLKNQKCFIKDPIIKAKLFENGYVALTRGGVFYLIKNFNDTVPIVFYDISTKLNIDSSAVTDFAFISAKHSKSERIECVFATTTHYGVIIIIEQDDTPMMKLAGDGFIEIHDVFCIKDMVRIEFEKEVNSNESDTKGLGFITAIALSYNNNQIALYRKEDQNYPNAVFVFKSNLDVNDTPRVTLDFNANRFCQIEKKDKKEILECLTFPNVSQFLWCGEEGLVICSRRFVLLVTLANTLFQFKIITRKLNKMGEAQYIHCLTEIDGLRVITNDSVFFIDKVTSEINDTCYYCSDAPPKKLIIAYNSSEEKRPECDQQLRELMNESSDLGEAVLMLVKAAAQTWRRDIQKIMLEAAHYGKVFLSKDIFNYHEFMFICKDIRILNNIRSTDNPRLISYSEYKKMPSKTLVEKTMRMCDFFMAEQITKQLHLKIKKVYQKWAILQIKSIKQGISADDEMLFYNMIQKKIAEIPNISYIKIAKKAFKHGKNVIGFNFLEHEKSIVIKIPQYIQLRKWDKALELSIQTFDSNMLFTVLDLIYRLSNYEYFGAIVNRYKKIDSIVFDYLLKNHEDVYSTYLQDHHYFEELFFYYLEEYFKSKTINERNHYLKEANNTKKKIPVTKDSLFDFKFYQNYLDDLELSQKMKKEMLKKDIIKQTDISTYDNTTYDVYYHMFETNSTGEIESKYKKFDIYPKSLSIFKIYSLTKIKATQGIPTIIRDDNKKNYLSLLNVAEFYIDQGNTAQAANYLKAITSPDLFEYKINLIMSIE